MNKQFKWVPLTSIEIAELKAQHFNQSEAAFIADVSPIALNEWHNRGLVPEPRQITGRGHRRRYNLDQLAYLQAMRALSTRGLRLKDAATIASTVLCGQIMDAFEHVCAAETIREATGGVRSFAVISGTEDEGDLTVELFIENKRVAVGNEAETGEDLHAWLARSCVEDAIVVAPIQLAFALRLKAERVTRLRATEAFQRELAAHADSFKRQPAEKATVAKDAVTRTRAAKRRAK